MIMRREEEDCLNVSIVERELDGKDQFTCIDWSIWLL